jgi:hypothetical protein
MINLSFDFEFIFQRSQSLVGDGTEAAEGNSSSAMRELL